MLKREWTYTTSNSQVVNDLAYSSPVVKVRYGTVYVKEYEKNIFFGLWTIIKIKEETVWDDDFKIYEIGGSNA